MKKLIPIFILVICFSLSLHAAEKKDNSNLLGAVLTDLSKKGVDQEDIDSMQGSIASMLKNGANRKDVTSVTTKLIRLGMHGKNLVDSVKSMDGLVKAGETPKEAGNVVSNAAHQAKREGLKGKALAERVHQAVRQRKAEKEALKKQRKQEKKKCKKCKSKKEE